MKRSLITVMVLMIVASATAGQQPDKKIRMLESEVRMLRLQLKALKKKLAPPSDATPADATATQSTTDKAAPRRGSKGVRVTKTFAIHESNPMWWRDSGLFAFELTLREMLKARTPKEAPRELLARNKFFQGEKIDWLMAIDSSRNVTEGEAGRDYYARIDDVTQQKERIAELKKQSRTGDREQRDARKKELVEAELKLDEIEAETRQLQKLMTYKGASMLKASYQAPSDKSSRGAGGAMVTLEVSVALSDQDTRRLEKYQQAKSKKYSSRGGRWPIKIVGAVESLRYDGHVIYVIVDGTWRDAPGDAEAGSRRRTSRPRGRRTRDRKSRDRGRPDRRRPPPPDDLPLGPDG